MWVVRKRSGLECDPDAAIARLAAAARAPQRLSLRRTLVAPPPQPASLLLSASLSAVQPVPNALEVRRVRASLPNAPICVFRVGGQG
jgi:hypothetical protein